MRQLLTARYEYGAGRMNDQIFKVGPNGFQALDPEVYQDEDELQKLLATHLELLAQIRIALASVFVLA